MSVLQGDPHTVPPSPTPVEEPWARRDGVPTGRVPETGAEGSAGGRNEDRGLESQVSPGSPTTLLPVREQDEVWETRRGLVGHPPMFPGWDPQEREVRGSSYHPRPLERFHVPLPHQDFPHPRPTVLPGWVSMIGPKPTKGDGCLLSTPSLEFDVSHPSGPAPRPSSRDTEDFPSVTSLTLGTWVGTNACPQDPSRQRQTKRSGLLQRSKTKS